MISHPPQLPGVLHSIAPVLDHYGYLAVGGFICLEDFGVPVPGETVLIAAALYAGAGRLNVVVVGIVALVAAVLGDNIGYLIGRLVGREAILRWGRYVFLTQDRMEKAEGFFTRQGGKIVVVARFIEGLRQANGIVAGITEMAWIKFLFFNALGAALWVGLWVTVGYSSGTHINTIYHFINKFSVYLFVALVIGVVALIVVWKAKRSRSLRATTIEGPSEN